MKIWVESLLGALAMIAGAGLVNAVIKNRTEVLDIRLWEEEYDAPAE